ncbi:hypothetical protein NO938_005390 [Citrobacter freundii]|uniref:hypothetical protein n=1 Tax=Citrobacter freundii TaxID=546 RepID=UPI001BCF897A|nr:hypothetical protein [Citrobacter freundii]EKT9265776.1 hypothetical protein [Citrobacter freundii]EKU4731123.1 hypothetical protein [Citrobacter freundii]EKV2293841.1 hypothetical protein [Citrobacter freundii]EKW0770606.1 hypothetical protein [Citrobacter freundii]MEC5591279.1 hypothetical protein [Citrobacter freundii]
MDGVTLIGLIGTIASLILAVVAIWLSVVFYKMSNEAAKETTAAAKDIKSSVERLENIFDKLYSDTFSMMRDTVTDMRQHIWRKPENPNAADSFENKDKLIELKNSISQEIIDIVEDKIKGLGDNTNKINELEESIKGILGNKLSKTLRDSNTSRNQMRRMLLTIIRRNKKIRLNKLIDSVNTVYQESFDLKNRDLINALFKMREEDIITWDGSPNEISMGSYIEYNQSLHSATNV